MTENGQSKIFFIDFEFATRMTEREIIIKIDIKEKIS